MKKKRLTILTVVLMICMVSMTSIGAFAIDVVDSLDPAYAYKNPKDIIIQTPGETYKTAAKQVSIYGASDYDYPIYMNDGKLTTTEHGFFAEYVDLAMGDNVFVFKNNDKQKTVTITRIQSGGGSGGSSAGVNIWDGNATPKYGIVEGSNISRMASPGTDNNKLLMPLTKGTAVQLTGDAGNLYRLSDGTFVYKSNLKVMEGTLQRTSVTSCEFLPLTKDNCTELRFKINQNPLYNLEMWGEWAILTVYNGELSGTIPVITPNKIIKSVDLLSNTGGKLVYSINFKDNAPINGYYVEFNDGYMDVGFKQQPILNGKDLTGVVIHVDPGHGGSESGALGAASTFGPYEKQINLRIAQAVKEYLVSRGATVTMTRTGDDVVGLAKRAAEVADSKPDFCISVHCNSMPATTDYNKSTGLLTFYSFDHEYAAKVVNDIAAQNLGMAVKDVNHKNLAMTRMTAYPAVLVESAFMSNPKDYEWLIKKENQDNCGTSIGKGVEAYILQTGALKDVSVKLNGKAISMDQPPVIKNDRTLVPLRAIFEALGAVVVWNEAEQKVTATQGATKMELVIGDSAMKVTDNGIQRTVTLDVPAQLVNDRTMVPVRAVSEAFSAKVDWDSDSRTVLIVK